MALGVKPESTGRACPPLHPFNKSVEPESEPSRALEISDSLITFSIWTKEVS